MAFRAAVHAGNISKPEHRGLPAVLGPDYDDRARLMIQNWTQIVDVEGQKSIVTFNISIPYLISAVAVSLLSVAALAPFYWNWKEGPPPLSFNPLHVANAFDAPLVQDAEKELVEQRVRYTMEGRTRAGEDLSPKVILEGI
jgi:hypothetical protein